jgi:hypothetical protein
MSILERVRSKLGSAPALRSLALAAVAIAALSAMGAAPALAQVHHWRGGGFHDRGSAHWRGGHWFHGPHGGRLGWWWIAGNGWYYYPAPVYPYPAYAASGPYYYCDYPPGYYPNVAQCATPWRVVPGPL